MNSCHLHKPRKKIRKRRERDTLADAITSCIPNLTADVKVDEIEDSAIENGCLTEDDRRLIYKSDDRKRQVRSVVLIITNRSYETMIKFLDALKLAYPYLSKQIWHHYETGLRLRPKHIISRRCPVCQLKNSVDVEIIIDELFSKNVINQQLYGSINSSNKSVGQQDDLWEAVLESCWNQQNGAEFLLELLDGTGHYSHITSSLRKLFKNNNCLQSFCTCSSYNLAKTPCPIKNRTFSNDSNTSYYPRESSESMTSSDLDLASELEICHRSSVSTREQADTHHSSEITVEKSTCAIRDPLNACMHHRSSVAEVNKRKIAFPDASVTLRPGTIQISTTENVKKEYVRMLSSPMSGNPTNLISDSRKPKRFKSIVNSALVKLRVVKRFMHKGHPEGLLKNNTPDLESVCETEL